MAQDNVLQFVMQMKDEASASLKNLQSVMNQLTQATHPHFGAGGHRQ